jgi:plasmid replication initiation protein
VPLARKELKKHVGAVHIRNRLTLLQRKIANILLLNAYEDLLTAQSHAIKVKQLATIAGFDSKDYAVLKDALVELTETSIEWNIMDEDGTEVWGVSSMLAQAHIKGGICEYVYSPMLRKKLYNPEVYARINLAIQKKFTSGYALALYENCVRYRSIGSTGWWELGLFRRLMGVEDSEYEDFKYLNKRVIKPAVAQVNENSDILLNAELKREKRRVTELRFIVKDNPQSHHRVSVKEQILKEMEVATKEHPVQESTVTVEVSGLLKLVHAKTELKERLRSFGIDKQCAEKLLKAYDEPYIKANLEIVEHDYLAGKVDNLPGYTIAALKADYRPKQIPFEVEQARKKQEVDTQAKNRAEAQVQLNSLEREFSRWRLQNALDGLTEAERQSLVERFQEANKTNLILRRFLKRGLEHPAVQSLFRVFASKALLLETPSDDEFIAYAAAQGHDLRALRRTAGLSH